MTKLIARPPKVRTVADLLEKLGGISPERVWFRPAPARQRNLAYYPTPEVSLW